MDENYLKEKIERQEKELKEMKDFFVEIGPILDKLDKNPKLVQAIIDHDFLDITPPKTMEEIDDSEYQKYMIENYDFIEHLQNQTIDNFLADLNSKFLSNRISKNDIEVFVKSRFRMMVASIFAVSRAYEKNKQK